MQMNINTYMPLAVKTESVPESVRMNQYALHALLEFAIAAGNVMDHVKRRIYYNKAIDFDQFSAALNAVAHIADVVDEALDSDHDINALLTDDEMAQERQATEDTDLVSLDDKKLNLRLLHAALGRFTESTEQIQALKEQFEGKGLDLINYAEEIGDSEWYGAIDKDEVLRLSNGQLTEGAIRLTNIEKLQGNGKLKGRYADGDFDAVRALRRDLTNERAILENK